MKLHYMHKKGRYCSEEAPMDSQSLAVREAARLCSPSIAPPQAASSGVLIRSVREDFSIEGGNQAVGSG